MVLGGGALLSLKGPDLEAPISVILGLRGVQLHLAAELVTLILLWYT